MCACNDYGKGGKGVGIKLEKYHQKAVTFVVLMANNAGFYEAAWVCASVVYPSAP